MHNVTHFLLYLLQISLSTKNICYEKVIYNAHFPVVRNSR